ncbi:SDR family oxidoreductase [Spirillospora sp. CA-294931]|uniref:SDR family oxidoreductase n=1 Tax=Spirillospora sp. CA-294931 TaxID=3240042 RepID=UPI003D921475
MTTIAPVPSRSPLPQALAGGTVVIVGGSSGIGLAAGTMLGTLGARVILVGRDPGRLDAAADRVRAAGAAPDSVLGLSADGGDEDALAQVFDKAGAVDHVLVTAGEMPGVAPVDELSRDVVRSGFDTRVWGALAAARLAAGRMSPGGSITLSSGAYLPRPVPNLSGAMAVIGAVEGMTRALAVEFGPRRLRVNTVRYGVVDTPLARGAMGLDSDEAVAAAGAGSLLGRFGTPEEAASAALFLMANNYVTGQVLTIDGGYTLG